MSRAQKAQPIVRTNIQRPWTRIADFFTGVEERAETYFSEDILKGWMGSKKEIEFKMRGSRYDKPTTLLGMPDAMAEIIKSASPGKQLTGINYDWEMQRLQYNNGKVRITVSRDPFVY